MPNLYVFCKNPNCNYIFPSAGLQLGGKSITISGVVEQCPNCGSMGEIPPGVFDLGENMIHFVSGPKDSLDKTKQVQEILRTAYREGSTKEEIVDLIKTVSQPIAEYAVQLYDEKVKSNGTQFSLKDWIFLLLGLLAIPSAFKETKSLITGDPSISKFQQGMIEQIETYREEFPMRKRTDINKATYFKNKQPRNSPCNCGSSKKYKKCHGAN